MTFSGKIFRSCSQWNSIIVECFRANQYNEVLRLYVDLRGKSKWVHGSAITFGIKSCVVLGRPEFARILHADAFKFGLSHDHFVGSSLIGFYSGCHQIDDAAKVFDEITDRDLVLYTSMITGYAQLGNHHSKNAFSVARDMQREGSEPNRVTLVSLLQCASRLGSLKVGRSIHGYSIKRGIGHQDEVFETSLMDMYVRCGETDKGTIIFDKMKKKTMACRNALIAGHLRLGQTSKALDLFLQMVQEKCDLDLIALGNGLLICADLGHLLLGKAIHSLTLRKGVHLDLVGTTALIDMYSKCKDLSEAVNIFDRSEDKDDVLFNVMISGYLLNGHRLGAIETFRAMVNGCISPNTSTIINLLSALSGKEHIREVKSIHGYVFGKGLEAITDIANQFVNIYAKCGFVACAKKVFDGMKVKDRVSWTSIMTGLVNHGLSHEALNTFLLMQRANLWPDSVTFTCLIQAVNHLGSLILVKAVHGHLYRASLEKDPTLINSLVTVYSRCGKLKIAGDLFEHMGERHLSSWNTMISAYGMHGDCVQALGLLNRMKKEDLVPDGDTFKAVLSACSHTGFIQEGLDAFKSMEDDYGIVPSDEHYGCMVDMLGRAGRLEDAYDLLRRAPSIQSAPTLGALLAACRTHGNVGVGERVGRWLLGLAPNNTSAHSSVSNLYAGGGKWDDAAYVGAIAKTKGLRRISGQSLVEIN